MLATRISVAILVLLAVFRAAAPLGALRATNFSNDCLGSPGKADFKCVLPASRMLGLLGRWLDGKSGSTIGLTNWNTSPLQRSRREAPTMHLHHHDPEMDSNFVHLPKAAIENFADGDRACEALRNASVLQQVLPVIVEPPCPMILKPLDDPHRIWPSHLVAAECACPAASCRSRSAYVCTQLYTPVVVVSMDSVGSFHQHRKLIPSGCRCMSARATLVLDEDFK